MGQDEQIREAIHGLLRENFRSGFDPASIIDRKKFARALCAAANLDAFEPDEVWLREEARRACLEWDGKFYAMDNRAWKYIAGLFETLRQEGGNLVNVDVLFTKYGAEFLKLGIISAGLLKEYLRQKRACSGICVKLLTGA